MSLTSVTFFTNWSHLRLQRFTLSHFLLVYHLSYNYIVAAVVTSGLKFSPCMLIDDSLPSVFKLMAD